MCKKNKEELVLKISIIVFFVVLLLTVRACIDSPKEPLKPIVIITTEEPPAHSVVVPAPEPTKPPCPCPGPCKKDVIKVLAFTATWCQPCQKAKALISKKKVQRLIYKLLTLTKSQPCRHVIKLKVCRRSLFKGMVKRIFAHRIFRTC